MGRRAALAAILGTVAVVYGNGLFGEFVWDDETIILSRGDLLADASNIPTILTSADSTHEAGDGSPYYRPLSILTFMLDYHLWGRDPFGYHLENLLLHGLVAVLVFLLADVVFGDRVLAWLTAMLFAVHPVHSESVSFVSARNNLLCLALSLASLLALWRSRSGGWRWASGSLALFFLSLLCKESAVAIPLLLAALALFARDPRLAAKNPILVAFFAVLGCYFAVRASVLGVFTSEAGLELSGERLRLVASAIFENMRLILIPTRLNAHYTPEFIGFSWAKAAAACSAIGLLAFFSVWRRSPEPIRVGSQWTLCGLVPISNLVAIPSAPVAERYLYAVVPGSALCLAWLLRQSLRRKAGLSLAAIGAILAASGAMAFHRNRVWADNLALDQSMVRADPANAVAHMHLGISYGKLGRAADAERELRESIRLDASNPRAWYNLAALLLERDRIPEAAAASREAVQLDPDFAMARSSLGVILARLGRPDEAVRELEAAAKLAPGDAGVHNNLGMMYGQLGRHAEALAEFETAVRLRSDLAILHFNLGQAYTQLGNADEARRAFRRAAELDPRFAR
jgi:Flp pilus assembly protein TadD